MIIKILSWMIALIPSEILSFRKNSATSRNIVKQGIKLNPNYNSKTKTLFNRHAGILHSSMHSSLTC